MTSQPTLVVRTTRWAWLMLALLAVAAVVVAALVVSIGLLGLDTLRDADGAAMAAGGVIALAFAAGLVGGTAWLLRAHGRDLAEEIGHPGGVTVAIGADGVTAGRRQVPWAEIRELVLAERDAGGDESGDPVRVPYLVVRVGESRAGDPLTWGPAGSMRDHAGDDAADVRAAVRRHAPGVPVTDLRQHT